MSALHIVKAAAAKISIGGAGGNRVAMILRRDDVVPLGVDDEQLARLVGRGILEAVESEDAPEEESAEPGEPLDEGVYKGVKVPELKAEIETRNEGRDEESKIVVAAPKQRPQIVAALLADDETTE